MTQCAPRISWLLVDAIPRLDGPDRSIAEVCREMGTLAEVLGLPRPRYEQVRVLVHRERRIRAIPGPAESALDLVFRAKSPQAAADSAWESMARIRAARHLIEHEREWRPDGRTL